MPEIVTNLNAPGRRAVYVKLRSKLELARPEDGALVQASMPRLIDLFQTYLREVRPEELRGSAGTQRLREELVARANIAVAQTGRVEAQQIRVNDVLFLEILVQ
jgi:flagellar FliL protein